MISIPIILLLLGLVGLVDAVYLTHAHLFGVAACGAGSGCDAVMASPYARIFGIPLSALGVGLYLAIIGLAWRAMVPDDRHESVRWLSLLSLVAIVPTVPLLYLQGFVIEAWCPFCLLSSALLTTILVVSWLDRRRHDLLVPGLGELPGWRQALPLLAALCVPAILFASIDRQLSAAAPPAVQESNHVVARVGARQITLAEMDRAIQLNLSETRTEMRNEWLDLQVLEAAAREKGVEVHVLLQQEVAIEPVTQQEIDDFFDANKTRMPTGVPRARLDPQIRDQLRREGGQRGRIEYIQSLRRRFFTELSPPPSERFGIDANPRGGPERGLANAPVTIIAFSDLQCSYCARAHRRLDALQNQRPNDIRLIYRHFPLDMHAHARYAAEVAACADQQDQFWDLADVMFNNQKQLKGAQVRAYAKELGLDMEQLNTCLESGAGSAAVAADVAEGDELGIHSTPSFFVNGHFLKNLPSEAGMEALIDRLAGVPTSP